MRATFLVSNPNGSCRRLCLHGRNAWALAALIRAGGNGCTPITHPGPRWSAYVHRLRHDYGLAIQTVHESHSGPFPGNHARYMLLTNVTILSTASEAA